MIAPGQLGRDQLLLAGNDHDEHVGDHPGANHRADLDVRRARAEQVAHTVGGDHDHHRQGRGQQPVVALEPPRERVVDQPANRQEADADGHRGQRADVGHAAVDQVRAGVGVVQHHQQPEAADPGGVRLPFEPVQETGQRRRSDSIFFDPIEAATMDLPRFAGNPFFNRPRVPGRAPVE